MVFYVLLIGYVIPTLWEIGSTAAIFVSVGLIIVFMLMPAAVIISHAIKEALKDN